MSDSLVTDPVTVDEIKTLMPDLVEELTDANITAMIEQATMQVLSDELPVSVEKGNVEIKIQHIGIKYLALHMITVFYGYTGGENVTSEKVDQVEHHFADTANLEWYNSSPWGKLYKSLLDQYSPTPRPIIVQA